MNRLKYFYSKIRNKFWKEYYNLFPHNFPQGWFDGCDIATYRRLMKRVPRNGTVVELGSWKGRSICSAADIIQKRHLNVYCVDTFQGSKGEDNLLSEAKENNILSIFTENIKRFGIESFVHTIPKLTNEAAKLKFPPVNLLFIDADHTYEGVRDDIKNWLPKMADHGGVVSGHDFGSEPISRAVYERFPKVESDANNIWQVVLS
jgi:methyltransferase family protein